MLRKFLSPLQLMVLRPAILAFRIVWLLRLTPSLAFVPASVLWTSVLGYIRRGCKPKHSNWTLPFEIFIANTRKTLSVVDFNLLLGRPGFLFGVKQMTKSLSVPFALASRLFFGYQQQWVRCNNVRCLWLVPKEHAHTHSSGAANPEVREVVLTYFHGGAYVFLSVESHVNMICKILRKMQARLDCLDKEDNTTVGRKPRIVVKALMVDYRLAPQHRFPAPVLDTVQAYDWLTQRYGLPADQLVLGGDSAGGGLCLSLMLVLRSRARASRNRSVVQLSGQFSMGNAPHSRQPACMLLLSPFVDLQVSGGDHPDAYIRSDQVHLCAKMYLGTEAQDALGQGASVEHDYILDTRRGYHLDTASEASGGADAHEQITPEGLTGSFGSFSLHLDLNHASPLYADLTDLPPMLVQVGEIELLKVSAQALVERAKRHGSKARLEVYENMPHVFQAFQDILPFATQALDRLADYAAMKLRPALGIRVPETVREHVLSISDPPAGVMRMSHSACNLKS